MLRLNDDGSITLLPMDPGVSVSSGFLAGPRHGVVDERLAAKERLMALALGAPVVPGSKDAYNDPDLLRVLASLYRGEVFEHKDLVALMLKYLDDACRYLAE